MTTVYTVGHGNRTTREFLDVLVVHQIRCVVDVRAYPVSRRHPHFSGAALQAHLCDAGIGYVWEGAALGGMRKPSPASPHIALKTGVRGFADHMASVTFQGAVARVLALADERPIAIMCAEKLPSQCHRSLISDALTVQSITVRHLIDSQPPQGHVISRLARVRGSTLIYDGHSQFSLL